MLIISHFLFPATQLHFAYGSGTWKSRSGCKNFICEVPRNYGRPSIAATMATPFDHPMGRWASTACWDGAGSLIAVRGTMEEAEPRRPELQEKRLFFLATWLFRSLGCWFWVGGLVGVVVGRYLEQMDSVAWSNIHQAKDALLAHSKEIWYSHILSGPVSLRVSQKIIPSPAPQS